MDKRTDNNRGHKTDNKNGSGQGIQVDEAAGGTRTVTDCEATDKKYAGKDS